MTAHDPTAQTAAYQRPCLGLWAGVIGAPALWSIAFLIGYAIPTYACEHAQLIHHILTIVFALATLYTALLCWRQWKALGGSADEDDGGPIARRRFLGALGMLVSLIFTMLIIAQGLPSFFFDGCWS
jgi:hypothetical protein